jgi:hypothetical protein
LLDSISTKLRSKLMFSQARCSISAMARYLGDLAPSLALLACLGALALREWAQARGARAAKLAAVAAIAASAVVSVFAIGAISIRIYDRIRQFNPAHYQTLARIANAPVHWLESFGRSPAGAMLLEVVFPAEARAGDRETLLATGWGRETDRVFVLYREGRQAVFGYEHAGAPPLESAPVTLDGGTATHEVRISLGSLMPPPTAPTIRALPDAPRKALLRRLRIELDSRVLLDRYQRAHEASPESVRPGGVGEAAPFRGRILAVAREPLAVTAVRNGAADHAAAAPAIRPDARGAISLRVAFPAAAAGNREPLVVTGETGRADFVVVEHLGGGRLRFLLDHWGNAPQWSEPMDFTAGREYRVEISHAAYRGGRANTRAPLRVTVDGRLVWECSALLFPIDADDFFVGFNPLGGSSCAERFTGTIAPDTPDR